METGWWRKYGLSKEERSRTVRSRAKVGYDRLSINRLEFFGMAWAAYNMIVTRNELPELEGEVVLMRGGNAPPVQWVLNCMRARGVMRILGVVEVGVKWGVSK